MMKLSLFKKIACTGWVLLLTTVVLGQTDIYWNATTVAPTSSGSNYTVSNITQNNSANASFIDNTSASTTYTFLLNSVVTNRSGNENLGLIANYGSLNTGSGGSAFIETTITPAAGYKINLAGVNFGSRSTGTGPLSYSIQYSIAGGSFFEVVTGTLLANSNWYYKNNPVTIAAGTNQSVTIRIYGYGGSGSVATSVNWRLDDIVITTTASLPVVFGRVEAAQEDNAINLQWTTNSETNNDHFEVQASKDGKEFKTIKTVQSLNGNSDTEQKYEVTISASDVASVLAFPAVLGLLSIGVSGKKRLILLATTLVFVTANFVACNKQDAVTVSAADNVFIRIKQVDKDGGFKYSEVIRAIQE